MDKIRAGIIGGAGYTGSELLRLLLHHPDVTISFVHSRSHAGEKIEHVLTDLCGDTDLFYTDVIQTDIDVLFLCMGHGESLKLLTETAFADSVRIIDLSQDFRINSGGTRKFIYGLPEFNRNKIREAKYIANPGCFATAIQLAVLPLLSKDLLNSDIHISATTGSTGAGQSLNETSHFSWRQNNLSVYKAFTHQHLAEVRQTCSDMQFAFNKKIIFLPQRGAFTRGILACVSLVSHETEATLKQLYRTYYASHPFTHLVQNNIDLKQVVNTNKCFLFIEKHNDELMIVSVIDNLLKGASGQAFRI